MSDDSEFHLQIIGLAEPDENGALHFSEDTAHQLHTFFREELEKESFPVAVDGFVRAVAAFHAGKQEKAVTQLMDIGLNAALELKDLNSDASEKLKASLTGADDLQKMKPKAFSEPPPEGAVKASSLIPPPAKRRG